MPTTFGSPSSSQTSLSDVAFSIRSAIRGGNFANGTLCSTTKGYAWPQQTWTGQGPAERKRRRFRRLLIGVGIPCAVLATLFQALLTLTPYHPGWLRSLWTAR